MKKPIHSHLPMLVRDQSGQGLTEYLILLVLVAVVSIGATQTLGNVVKSKIQQSREEINKIEVDGGYNEKSSKSGNSSLTERAIGARENPLSGIFGDWAK